MKGDPQVIADSVVEAWIIGAIVIAISCIARWGMPALSASNILSILRRRGLWRIVQISCSLLKE